MKPIKDFDKVQASGEFERLPAGGYVIRITGAADVVDDHGNLKEYLRIVYDIAEGPETGRYKNETADNDYRHSFIRSYKDKALGMFKAFTNALEESNPGYKWDWNEAALAGKILGVVIGYEEYEANDGSVKERQRIASCISADRVREGDFKVPELKKLKADKNAIPEGFTALTDADLPF